VGLLARQPKSSLIRMTTKGILCGGHTQNRRDATPRSARWCRRKRSDGCCPWLRRSACWCRLRRGRKKTQKNDGPVEPPAASDHSLAVRTAHHAPHPLVRMQKPRCAPGLFFRIRQLPAHHFSRALLFAARAASLRLRAGGLILDRPFAILTFQADLGRTPRCAWLQWV
jgi:hypothetical protein